MAKMVFKKTASTCTVRILVFTLFLIVLIFHLLFILSLSLFKILSNPKETIIFWYYSCMVMVNASFITIWLLSGNQSPRRQVKKMCFLYNKYIIHVFDEYLEVLYRLWFFFFQKYWNLLVYSRKYCKKNIYSGVPYYLRPPPPKKRPQSVLGN